MSRRTGRFQLALTRELAASRGRVFHALTSPDELRAWWGPHDLTTPEIELDLRVGGRYRFTMQPPDGDRFHLSGEFLQVDPPARLAYTFRWEEPAPDDQETVVTLMLDAVAEATRLSIAQGEFATEERLALHRSGWSDSLDKLSALLAADT